MALRFAGRLVTRRGFNTSAARRNLQQEMMAEEKHAEGLFYGFKWKLYVVFPV